MTRRQKIEELVYGALALSMLVPLWVAYWVATP